MIVVCQHCGESFNTKPAEVKAGNGKYCSRECFNLARRRRIIRYCLNCGKEFKITPVYIKRGGGKYCSVECYDLAKRTKIKRNCETCSKEFWIVPGRIKVNGGKYCSDECYRLGKIGFKHSAESIKKMSGENSPHWKGGISFEPYTTEFNKQLKELIRFRDNYFCQKCECSEIENGEKLSIHHIDYDKENCLPDNLISLCRKCNSSVNSNRSKWTEYFENKIKINQAISSNIRNIKTCRID